MRSSAIGEDSKEKSFAGEFETFLNVRTEEDFLKAVKRCWASALNPQVAAGKFDPDIILPMAVGFQIMVSAEISGVAFSADPVTRDPLETVINAAYGLCEGVVDGQFRQMKFVMIIGRELWSEYCRSMKSVKDKMRVMSEEEGTREAPVGKKKANKWALTSEQQKEIVKAVLDLRKRLGYEVDVEWSYYGGRLYLLQRRPITTFSEDKAFPVYWQSEEEKARSWRLSPEFGAMLPLADSLVAIMNGGAAAVIKSNPLDPLSRTFNGLLYHSYAPKSIGDYLFSFYPRFILNKIAEPLYSFIPWEGFKRFVWAETWNNSLPEVEQGIKKMRE